MVHGIFFLAFLSHGIHTMVRAINILIYALHFEEEENIVQVNRCIPMRSNRLIEYLACNLVQARACALSLGGSGLFA